MTATVSADEKSRLFHEEREVYDRACRGFGPHHGFSYELGPSQCAAGCTDGWPCSPAVLFALSEQESIERSWRRRLRNLFTREPNDSEADT